MGKYIVEMSARAKAESKKVEKSGRKLDLKKIEGFILEIEEAPRAGTGRPERLRHRDGEVWSRKINDKDRFVYEVFEGEMSIEIESVLGHYGDR